MAITKQEDPAGVSRVAWGCDYQRTNNWVSHNKKCMITKWEANVSLNDLIGANSTSHKLVDGLQYVYSELDSIDKSLVWKLGRGFNGMTSSDVNSVASGLYAGTNRNTPIFAQIQEDRQTGSGFGEVVEPVFRRVFELQQANESGTTIDNSEIYGDYFEALNGFGTTSSLSALGGTKAILAMSSSAEAQNVIYHEPNSGNGFTDREQGYYYRFNAFDYRHRQANGYFDGIGRFSAAKISYEQIFDLERQYIAMSNRKIATFGWHSFEGVNAIIEKEMGRNALHFESPNGDILRLGFREGSFEMAKAHVFFGLLIGDRYIMWHDNGRINTASTTCWGRPYESESNPDRIHWRPNNGGITNWQSGNSSQPQPVCSTGQAGFPVSCAPNFNGAFAGHYLYGRIWDYANANLTYPTFSYVENGVSKTGYFDGNTPQTGTLGAKVSRFGVANIGQHNIVNQYVNGKKPIVMYGEGTDSAKKCIIVKNPNAGYQGSTVYSFPDIGGGITITHRGSGLGVYRL